MSSKSKLFNYFTDEVVVMCLAFIGGFIDAAGYIKLFRVFTSSITGNLVVACASLYNPEGVLCRFLVSLCFAGGGGILTTLAVQMKVVQEVEHHKVSMVLFMCEALIFVAIWIVGHIYSDEIDNGSLGTPIVILLGCMMGFSMGIHNSAAKETIANCPSTTVMTMTLVSLSSASSNTLNLFLAKHGLLTMHPKGQTAASYKIEEKFLDNYNKLMVAVKPLITFLVGALTGASTMHEMDFHCMFIPLFVVLTFVVDLGIARHIAAAPASPAAKPSAAAAAAPAMEEKSIELNGIRAAEYAAIEASNPVSAV